MVTIINCTNTRVTTFSSDNSINTIIDSNVGAIIINTTNCNSNIGAIIINTTPINIIRVNIINNVRGNIIIININITGVNIISTKYNTIQRIQITLVAVLTARYRVWHPQLRSSWVQLQAAPGCRVFHTAAT